MRKKVENKKINKPALPGANISEFFFLTWIMCTLSGGMIQGTVHPDPGPNVKVQVWETGASENWRFFESFFWYPTFHRRSQKSQTLGASESFAPLFRASEIFAPVFKIKPGKTLLDL